MKRRGWQVRSFCIALQLCIAATIGRHSGVLGQNSAVTEYIVQPGDTWFSLAYRFGQDASELQAAQGQVNRQRQPSIGSVLTIPSVAQARTGLIGRTNDGGLLQSAVRNGLSPWLMAIRNNMHSPYSPLMFRPLVIPDDHTVPREWPFGFKVLEVSLIPGRPGQALAIRGRASGSASALFRLDGEELVATAEGPGIVALIGTGAFFGSGEPELSILPDGGPLWVQPWRFEDPEWSYEQITLSGAAAAIDADSIAQERQRLSELWSVVTPHPLWRASFERPIDSFLEISSLYGARRSYNGGPYRSYHEGVDFSAYGGTPVHASASGVVVLAETLYVRGGAVIIDHGLGVYTGYYHMSSVNVEAGTAVEKGQEIGSVGTTGLSTGNHLHWDLLVGGIWVDAGAWLDRDVACWILAGLGLGCG